LSIKDVIPYTDVEDVRLAHSLFDNKTRSSNQGISGSISTTTTSASSSGKGVAQSVYTLNGIARSDSAEGVVMVEVTGETISSDNASTVEMDCSCVVKNGQQVIITVTGTHPVVTDVIGWGDTLEVVAEEAEKAATEAKEIAEGIDEKADAAKQAATDAAAKAEAAEESIGKVKEQTDALEKQFDDLGETTLLDIKKAISDGEGTLIDSASIKADITTISTDLEKTFGTDKTAEGAYSSYVQYTNKTDQTAEQTKTIITASGSTIDDTGKVDTTAFTEFISSAGETTRSYGKLTEGLDFTKQSFAVIDESAEGMTIDITNKVPTKEYVNTTFPTKVYAEYAVSDSAEKAPDASSKDWSEKETTREAGKYIWVRTVSVYADETKKYSEAALLTGNTGASGATGASVTNVAVTYALGSSSTDHPTSGWSSDVPDWTKDKYIWQRTAVTITDGDGKATTTYTYALYQALNTIYDKTATVEATLDEFTSAYKTVYGDDTSYKEWLTESKQTDESVSSIIGSITHEQGIPWRDAYAQFAWSTSPVQYSLAGSGLGWSASCDLSKWQTGYYIWTRYGLRPAWNLIRGSASFNGLGKTTEGNTYNYTTASIRVSLNGTLTHENDTTCAVPKSDCVTITATTTNRSGFCQDKYPSVNSNYYYTLSCWVYASAECTVRVQPLYWSSIDTTTTYYKDFSISAGKWTQLYHTYKPAENQTNVSVGCIYFTPKAVGDTLKVCGIKLEERNNDLAPTAWCCSRDEADGEIYVVRHMERVSGTSKPDTLWAQYYQSTLPTECTGGSWSSTRPAWDDEKYLWMRVGVRTSDGTTYTDPYCILGATAFADAWNTLSQTAKETHASWVDFAGTDTASTTKLADIVANANSITESVSSIYNGKNGVLDNEITTRRSAINTLTDRMDETDIVTDDINSYMRFYDPTGGEPMLEIGTSNSEYKSVLSNERLVFEQGRSLYDNTTAWNILYKGSNIKYTGTGTTNSCIYWNLMDSNGASFDDVINDGDAYGMRIKYTLTDSSSATSWGTMKIQMNASPWNIGTSSTTGPITNSVSLTKGTNNVLTQNFNATSTDTASSKIGIRFDNVPTTTTITISLFKIWKLSDSSSYKWAPSHAEFLESNRLLEINGPDKMVIAKNIKLGGYVWESLSTNHLMLHWAD
jgi:hypothetical protein